MILDIVAAVLCGLCALAMFQLQAFGDPKRDRWMNMPWYVRWGLIACGATFAIRSADLMSLSSRSLEAIGHVNLWGVFALATLAYTMIAIVVWSGVFKSLPKDGWYRLNYAEEQVKKGRVPVMVRPEEVEPIALARGNHANGHAPDEMPAVPPHLANEKPIAAEKLH